MLVFNATPCASLATAANGTMTVQGGGLQVDSSCASAMALSAGVYKGLSFFQERANTQAMTISGNAGLSGVRGGISAAGARLALSGNGTLPGQIIVDRLELGGNGSLTVPFASR
ncbi:MAG: hypothetical protein NTZ05_17995 [Chloroflexi bacterium]|nr:hypothetical protein [Chloroflexota bacterium]